MPAESNTGDDDLQEIVTERDDEGRILVTIRELFRGEKTTITGWAEAREDLGLNKAGDALDGVELINQEPYFVDEDDEYPRGHTEVTLAFADADTLDTASEHLHEQATERFEWGADGEVVQKFAGKLPRSFEVSER